MSIVTTGVSELRNRLLAWVAGGLMISAAGVGAIVGHESLRFTSYPDPGTGGAPWTICYGHTGPEVKPGMTVSRSQCERWLSEDLKKAESVIRATVKVPLQQGEVDAYTSFIFNVGGGNWRSSTLLKKLNAGDRKGACDQLPRWIYADKRVLNGLKKRRYDERAVCLSGGAYVYRP